MGEETEAQEDSNMHLCPISPARVEASQVHGLLASISVLSGLMLATKNRGGAHQWVPISGLPAPEDPTSLL